MIICLHIYIKITGEIMRILFYISTIQGGGAARVMVNLANSFFKNGEQVYFVINLSTDHDYELFKGIDCFVLDQKDRTKNKLRRTIDRVTGLRKLIKSIKPDICVSFMKENNYRLLVANIGLQPKTIVSVRNDPKKVYGKGIKRLFSYVVLGLSDGIVFQTDDAKDYFPSFIRKKSEVIMNEVSDSFYSKNTNHGSYFLAAGRLSKQKNYPMLLEAFKIACDHHPDIKLKIYGEGKLLVQLKQLSESLNISSNVSFEGFSNDMMSVYSDAICLLLSSDYEGVPNTMLESLAASVPVISTDCPCGGPRMIIQNSINGYLVPLGDSEAFADAIEKVINDVSLHEILKQGAYNTAQQYRADKIHAKWNVYFHKIIAS